MIRIILLATAFAAGILSTSALMESSFSLSDHEDSVYAKGRRSEVVVLALREHYRVFLEQAEKEIGRSTAEYKWLHGLKNHPSQIHLSSTLGGCEKVVEQIEYGLNRVFLAGLIFRGEESIRNLPLEERASKFSEFDFKYTKKAKVLTDQTLKPYKKALEEISIANTVQKVKACLIPKEPKPEAWYDLFGSTLALNDD